MIPAFDRTTGNLPPGIHGASFSEFEKRFASTNHRRTLLKGLEAGIAALRAAGCRRIYVDGSFVTRKQRPGDFDACWESRGVNIAALRILEPALLDTRWPRAAQNNRFGGEFFPAETAADVSGTAYLEFFQRDKRTGQPKGIVLIQIGDLR